MSRYNDFFDWADPIDRDKYTFAPEALDAADKVREVFPFNTLGGRATAMSPLVEDVRQWAADQGFHFPDDQLNAFVDYVSSGCAWDYPNRAKEKNPKRFNIFGVAWHLEKARLRRASTTPPEPFKLRGIELRWLEPREITFADVDKVLTEHTLLTHAGYGHPNTKPEDRVGNDTDTVRSMVERLKLFTPWVIDNVPVQKSVTGDVRTTYGWKHIVEDNVGSYMSNTEFIVLALALGIPLRLSGLNPDVGVPKVVGDILEKRARHAKRLSWEKARS